MAEDLAAIVTGAVFATHAIAGCTFRPSSGAAGFTVSAIAGNRASVEPLGLAGAAQTERRVALSVAELAGHDPRPVNDPGGTVLLARLVIPAASDGNPVPAGFAGTWQIRTAEPDRLGGLWRCTLEQDG